MIFDVCVIGHITRDIIRIGEEIREIPGGTAYYFPLTFKNLDIHSNVGLVTKLANEDRILLEDLIKRDIRVFCKSSEETTVFENIYTKGLDFRIQKVRAKAQPFSIEDVLDISAKIFHLGPLTKEDIPIEVLKNLSKKSKVSLDIQGFVRDVEGGEVKVGDWEDKEEGLAYVNILKANEEEAKILTDTSDVRGAAMKLARYGIEEVVITLGRKGSLVLSNDKFFSFPAFPPKREVDVTGCGDTYIAAYIYKRLRACDIEDAGRFAAAIASSKIESFGAFKGGCQFLEVMINKSKGI
ncbi:MAG: PfkB family carbohydrate kinase [Candidatus Methanospirareceae archaeon]